MLEIVAVLEGAGLALVGVDREQARRRFGAHQRPFAAGRKAGAAEAAQAGIADDLDEVVARALAADAGFQQAIAAAAHVGVERVRRRIGMRVRGLRRGGNDLRRVGLHHLHMADGADRRAIAGAHARRAHDAHVGAERLRQFLQQALGAGQRAGQRIADAHGDRRRRRLALLHHVEMRVEGRDLIDFGQRKLHLLRQRGEMRGGQMAVMVLDQMQMLDQQIAPARPVGEQRLHLVERLRIDLPALRRARRSAPAGSPALGGR